MVNVDPGYAYEKLAYCSTQGVEESVRNTAIEELRKIPEVDKVSACYDLPISGMSEIMFHFLEMTANCLILPICTG